ncbi:MAG TPA: hypothetical protein VFC46_11390 [Humisphaera sp.]|nr:hypothetical protein [Humisphaera sp.]
MPQYPQHPPKAPLVVDYATPQPPKKAPWYKYEYSPLDLAIFLFALALLITLAKYFGEGR